MKKIFSFLVAALFIIFTFLLPFNSSLCVSSVKSGIGICLDTLIPSLFPFLCLSSLLSSYCGTILSVLFARFLCPLFNISVPACSAFVLGILGGFPSGAQCSASLFKNKKITKEEAERLPIFCNNAGLMFVISSVGINIFGSLESGVLLYFVHIFSSVIAGTLTRPNKKMYHFEKGFFKDAFASFSPESPLSLIPKCIFNSVKAMASVCANFLLFRTISYILFSSFSPKNSLGLLKGIFEMVGGIYSLDSSSSALIFASAILGFNGFCVHAQSCYFFSSCSLSFRKCIFGKIICALLSSSIMYIILSLSSFSFLPFSLSSSTQITISISFILLSVFFLFRKKIFKAL